MKNLLYLGLAGALIVACKKPNVAPTSPTEQPTASNEGNENQGEGQGEGGSSMNGGALVIKHGWDVPRISALSNPLFVQEVQDSPYDGVIFSAGDASRYAFYGDSLEQSVIDNQFAQMSPTTFNREMHNYVRLHVDTMGGFNGPNIDTFVDNIKRFAEAAKNAGFKGIAFDNENYWGSPWEWIDSPTEGACPGATRGECGEAAYDVGYAMMEAIIEVWPDVHFMPFFGIWLRDQASWTVIQNHSPGNNWYNANKVEGEFLIGVFGAIIDNCAMATKFIDGGEVYGVVETSDFSALADQFRNGLPANCPLFPDYLRVPYANNVHIGFGIYDFRMPLFGIPPLTSAEFSEMVENSMQEADYVWLYPEMHDWWEHDGNNWPADPVPQQWKDDLEAVLNP